MYSKLKEEVWLGILSNEKEIISITLNLNVVARIKKCLNRHVNCRRMNRKRVECQPAQIKKDAQAIQDL